jgi:hypothetical protein
MVKATLRKIVITAALVLSASTLFGQDVLSVAPQNFRVLFENDQVRVLRETLNPGEQQAFHEHAGRVTFTLTDSRLTLADATGATGVLERRAGDISWGEPTSHAVTNNGGGMAEYIHFEIKTPPTREFSSSTSMMGGTINILLDSPRVRVLDLKLPRGQKAISAQTANRVLLALAPFKGIAEFDASTRERIDSQLHDVRFLAEGLDVIENTSKAEIHALVVELK